MKGVNIVVTDYTFPRPILPVVCNILYMRLGQYFLWTKHELENGPN